MNWLNPKCMAMTGVLCLLVSVQCFSGILPAGQYYQEQGDAGNRFNPQVISPYGVDFVGIMGSIGGADMEDAFLFYYGGGDFMGNIYLNTQPADVAFESTFINELILNLYMGDGSLQLITQGPSAIAATLDPGSYILEICTNDADPPFTFGLTGPTTGRQNIITSPIPEPVTLSLVGLGLAGAALLRRRSRR